MLYHKQKVGLKMKLYDLNSEKGKLQFKYDHIGPYKPVRVLIGAGVGIISACISGFWARNQQLLSIPKGTFEKFASGLVEKFNSGHDVKLSMPTNPEHFGSYSANFGVMDGTYNSIGYESSVASELVSQIDEKISSVATQLPSGKISGWSHGTMTDWVTSSGAENLIVDLNNLKRELVEGSQDIISNSIDWGSICSSAVVPFMICTGLGVAGCVLPKAIEKASLKKKIKACYRTKDEQENMLR